MGNNRRFDWDGFDIGIGIEGIFTLLGEIVFAILSA